MKKGALSGDEVGVWKSVKLKEYPTKPGKRSKIWQLKQCANTQNMLLLNFTMLLACLNNSQGKFCIIKPSFTSRRKYGKSIHLFAGSQSTSVQLL